MGVYSTVFLVPKPSGGWCMILDLNRFIVKKHFRMEPIISVLSLLQSGDMMVSLDLKGAYFHITISFLPEASTSGCVH